MACFIPAIIFQAELIQENGALVISTLACLAGFADEGPSIEPKGCLRLDQLKGPKDHKIIIAYECPQDVF